MARVLDPLKDPYQLPKHLPVPVDDGLADHLSGISLPKITLLSTTGRRIDLSALSKAVVYFYPRTGVPGEPAGDDWNWIPGARGCTPQSCGFRDTYNRFKRLGVAVYGCSTQTMEFQKAFAKRNQMPFEFLSDAELILVTSLRLPTFQYPVESGGPNTLIKRMAWYIEKGQIVKVWYPVFPPDKNAVTVLTWLESKGSTL